MSEKLFSGIEGGTNVNCEVGNSPENIIDEARFETTTKRAISVTKCY